MEKETKNVNSGKNRSIFKSRKNDSQKEIILFVICCTFLVCILILKYSLETNNNLQQGTLQVMEIVITAGIGYLINSFFDNGKLRSYALSAWRRISDVKKTIERLKNELLRLNALGVSDIKEIIRPTNAIVEELEASIISSEIDWYDVIDKDVENLRKLIELEQQKSILLDLIQAGAEENKIKDANKKLEIINPKIQALRSILPPSAQENLLPGLSPSDLIAGNISESTISRLERVMFRIGRISIGIIGLPKDINIEILNEETPFELWPMIREGSSWYVVKGKSGIELGVWRKDAHFTETRIDYEMSVLFFLREQELLEDIDEFGAIRLKGSKPLRIIDKEEFLIAIPKPKLE